MNRFMIGAGVVGIGILIALGARNSLIEQSPEPAGGEAAAGSDLVSTLDVAMASGGESIDSSQNVETPNGDVAFSGAEGEGRAPTGGRTEGSDLVAMAGDAGPAGGSSGREASGEGSPVAGLGGDSGRGASGGEPGAADVSTVASAVQQPDVETVLRAASRAYASVSSLRADFVMHTRNPLLRTAVESRGALYQRRPDRFLMSFTEPAGDVIVSDGTHIWIYYPSTDARQVIRTPAGVGGAAGVDLQAQFLGDPLTRFDAALEGRESVQGRPAHVVRMIPREPVGYRELKVWIDGEDWLARRFEITEESGVVRRIELGELRIDPSLSNDLFHFTPPPGATVVDRG